MERKDVPIHLVFGHHTVIGLANLDLIDRIARETLQSHPSGSVGIFTEAGDATTTQVDFFQSLLQRGVPPSESLISSHLMKYPKPLPYWPLFWMYKLDFLLNSSNFRWKEFKLLDTLTKDYPGQIYPVMERGTQSEISQAWFASMIPNEFSSSLWAEIHRDREDRMTEVIQRTILETDIGLMVGHLGTVHTGVGISLKKAGFQVKRYFPEKVEHCYTFDSRSRSVRQSILFPKKDS